MTMEKNRQEMMSEFEPFKKSELSKMTFEKQFNPGSVLTLDTILHQAANLNKQDICQLQKKVGELRDFKYPRKQTPKYLYRGAKTPSYEEFERILSSFQPEEYRIKTLCMFMALTGPRITEALRLKIKDIDFDKDRITLAKEKVVNGFLQKRELPLLPQLKIILQEYFSYYSKEIKQHEGFVFYSTVGKCKTPYMSSAFVLRVWRRACERAGLNKIYAERENGPNRKKAPLYNYTLHSIRHLWGTYLADMGVQLPVAQYLFGHASQRTTGIYFGVRQETAEKEYERVFAVQQNNPR